VLEFLFCVYFIPAKPVAAAFWQQNRHCLSIMHRIMFFCQKTTLFHLLETNNFSSSGVALQLIAP